MRHFGDHLQLLIKSDNALALFLKKVTNLSHQMQIFLVLLKQIMILHLNAEKNSTARRVDQVAMELVDIMQKNWRHI